MIVERLLLKGCLLFLTSGKVCLPVEMDYLIPPFAHSCLPFMHGQVQPLQLPQQVTQLRFLR